MSDPAEQQAAFAELLTELALQHLHPVQSPLRQAALANTQQVLEQLAEAMAVMYPCRGS